MDWAEVLEDVADTIDEVFGETITLPDLTEVTGRFFPSGQPRFLTGEATGIDARLFQEPQPVLYLGSDDGDELADGDVLTVRGVEYGISRIDLDTDGRYRIELLKVR